MDPLWIGLVAELRRREVLSHSTAGPFAPDQSNTFGPRQKASIAYEKGVPLPEEDRSRFSGTPSGVTALDEFCNRKEADTHAEMQQAASGVGNSTTSGGTKRPNYM